MSLLRIFLTSIPLAALLLSGPIQAEEPDWSDYAALLKQYVSTGEHHGVQLSWVNYRGLGRDPRWHRIVNQVASFPPQHLATQNERLAFYINAYNIMTMKVVVENWPLESIKDVGNVLWPVWKKSAGRVAGREVSLNDIEHGILRPMGEPRVHFTIVCASISCPDLRQEPYTADKLEHQLDDQARRFLNNGKKGFSRRANGVHVSKIFSWFEEDFAGKGGIVPFIQRYRPLPEGLSVHADLPYDWRVNGG